MASLFYEIKRKINTAQPYVLENTGLRTKKLNFLAKRKLTLFLFFVLLFVWYQIVSQPNTYRNFSHRVVFDSIGSNDDIDVLNNSLEDLVEGLCLKLQCQQSQVHLVHEENWFDSLSNSLSQYSFCLHTHTFKTSSIEFRLGNLGFYWSAN